MKRYITILLSIMCILIPIHSQVDDKEQYVVLMFERFTGVHHANKEVYFWITPIQDSLSVDVRPLYANILGEPFVSEALPDCIKGDTIEFWRQGELNNEYYKKEIEKFTKIVSSHKLFLQKITKKWNKENNITRYKDKKINMRNTEIVNVYGIPISGKFCNCIEFASRNVEGKTEFGHRIFMPISEFEYIKDFWSTQKGKVLKFIDFSTFEFDKEVPTFITHKNKIRLE